MAWVQENLERNGYLTSGSIQSVTQRPASFLEDGASFTAKMYELDIDYTPGATGARPRTALLKLADPGFWELGGGRNEVLFYQFALETGVPLQIPDCYGFEIDDAARRTALMLELVQGNFERLDWARGERVDHRLLKRMVETMAELHGAFWGVDVPQKFERSPNSRAKIDFQIGLVDFYNTVEAFLRRANDFLGARERRAFERYAGVFIDRLKDYLDEGRPQTIVHGDTHVWNFLIPTDEDGPPILLDWPGWDIDGATFDLAYGVVARANEAIVKHHEADIIAAYRARLARAGVDYGDDDFWYDYRHAITYSLFTPIMLAQLVPGMPDLAWQETIAPIMAAMDKHGCWELLN